VGNVRGPASDGRGDVPAGLAAAEVVVEGDYRTQVQSIAAWSRTASSPTGGRTD